MEREGEVPENQVRDRGDTFDRETCPRDCTSKGWKKLLMGSGEPRVGELRTKPEGLEKQETGLETPKAWEREGAVESRVTAGKGGMQRGCVAWPWAMATFCHQELSSALCLSPVSCMICSQCISFWTTMSLPLQLWC